MNNYSIRAIAPQDILPPAFFKKAGQGALEEAPFQPPSLKASTQSTDGASGFDAPDAICFVAETEPPDASGAQSGQSNERQMIGAVQARFVPAAPGKSGTGIGEDAGVEAGIGKNPGIRWPRCGIPELTLAVLSAFQCKGVGANLLRRMHRALTERGCTRVSLWAPKGDPVIDFFLREGYLITSERRNGYDLIRPLGTTLRIRRISLEEVPEAAALITACWRKAYRGIVDDDYLDGLSNLERTLLMTKKFEEGLQEALILFANGRMAGVSIFGPSATPEYPDDGEITAFYLRPEHIGSGYGHPLFMATRRELQRRGYGNLVLDVFSENLRGIHFYAAHGFSKVLEKDLILGEKRYRFDIMRAHAAAPE